MRSALHICRKYVREDTSVSTCKRALSFLLVHEQISTGVLSGISLSLVLVVLVTCHFPPLQALRDRRREEEAEERGE